MKYLTISLLFLCGASATAQDGTLEAAVGPGRNRIARINNATFPLPVTLADLTVEKRHSGNLLKWTTTSEFNNSLFKVEKSSDGREFQYLGEVPSRAFNGISSGILYYTFEDPDPLPGPNYYRLVQYDLDGRFQYSLIRPSLREPVNP